MKNSLFILKSSLSLLLFMIFSWFLVHVLAVLGIFLAWAYPIWWYFVPQQTICISCRTKDDGGWCSWCRKRVIKSEGSSPKNFTSTVLNGAVILVFSFVSIGLIFGELHLLRVLGFPQTPKTVSFVLPSKNQYRLREIFPMKIEITGIKTSINAVQADLKFDATKLELIDITTVDSFANIFIQKEVNNEAGYARLTGGVPNPGFSSDIGTFGTLYFKAKTPGLVTVSFLPSSLVLANDGKGSNVLKDLSSVSYLILPEAISSDEELLQEEAFRHQDVLGTNTEQTQMTFYEQTKVLGAKTTQAAENTVTVPQPSIWERVLSVVARIDTIILEQYQKLIHLITKQ